MTVEELKASGRIVFEAICGSRSFGLDTETSDTDIHGVYMASMEELSSLCGEPPKSVKDPSSNVEYWEMRQFLEMLRDGKPNALELLYSPERCILHRDEEIMGMLEPYDQFVSVLCNNTFYRYAMSQVDKARGENKKIMNPLAEKRKSVLEFCYVLEDGRSVPLLDVTTRGNLKYLGLAAIDRVPNMYAAYLPYGENEWTQGFVRDEETSCELCLSSVPKGMDPTYYVYWNKDGFTMHCKQHRQYWDWVRDRNDVRFAGTMAHGKGYDAKNMMHTFRLLHMGLEITRGEGVKVDRTFERDYLLGIKSGAREYDDLVAEADDIVLDLMSGLEDSTLPPPLKVEASGQLLANMRKVWFSRGGM